MDSNSTLRTDDFRCHDLRLVSIDSSRTDEVVHVANDLLSKGVIDGFYINDPAIQDWSFLKEVPGIKRYIFSYNSPPKIPGVVMEYVNHARELTIDLSKTDGDLSGFSQLEKLGVYWREGVDFSHLEQLRNLSLWGVKKGKLNFFITT